MQKKFLCKALRLDIFTSPFMREPLCLVNFTCIQMGKTLIFHCTRIIQHECICLFKIFTLIEMHINNFQTRFFHHFTHNGIFRIFAFIHIACHKNIILPAILLYEKYLRFIGIFYNHADRR